MSADATKLIGDEDDDRSLGEGLDARLRAPFESILIGLELGLSSCFNFFLPAVPDFAKGLIERLVADLGLDVKEVEGVMEILG